MPEPVFPTLRPIGTAHTSADSNERATVTDAAASTPATSATGRRKTSISARRILSTQDFLATDSVLDREGVLLSRAHAATQFRLQLSEVRVQLDQLRKLVAPVRHVPTRLVGTIQQPNGTTAERLQVELALSTGTRTIRRSVFTNTDGEFVFSIPAGIPFPTEGLSLSMRGQNGHHSMNVATATVSTSGLIDIIRLPIRLQPLPQSIVASLLDLIPTPGEQDTTEQPEPRALFPDLTLGENGHCQYLYSSNAAYDRFRYGVFIRLVEPRTSIVTPVLRIPVPGSNRTIPTTGFGQFGQIEIVDSVEYVDRVPVDQPISVDGFRDQLIGIGNGNVVGAAETVPMAGTLGLGYVLHLAQKWSPKGLTLGNLVYSLPLAPGEQQRVAIFERRETSFVQESETLSIDEEQSFSQDTDSSTDAVFTSAFEETASGGSSFSSSAKSKGFGWFGLLAGGGSGSSSSQGNSSSWMNGHRDTVQRAAQDVHTSVERHAAARRRLNSTSMRLASNFESAEVTTKVITNHNHTRALTLQYWEVQRLFEISTAVEGATLVCLIPMQVVRFLPPGQPIHLTTPAVADQRTEILARYSLILKHGDILRAHLPRRYRHGLDLIRKFASDPTATFEPAGGSARDVIHFSLDGTFLPFEHIYVSAVTSRGSRLGPAQLTGNVPVIPEVWGNPDEAFPTQDALMNELRKRRAEVAKSTLSGDLALPPSLARHDIVGFEITRRFSQFDYDLVNPAAQILHLLEKAKLIPEAPPDHLISGTVHLTPSALERELGGPFVENFNAKIHPVGVGGTEESYATNYLAERHELPPGSFPMPAAQLSPVLRYTQLLKIEEMAQHVVNNTLRYSKAVWESLSAEERAVMLEAYTIGVPPGGIEDETQNIPLLNCIENRVLGYFGNSMIMPFNIPRAVVDELDIANRDIQDLLTEFHQSAFAPPKSVIALPTKGVLGEAVLGSCPSAEKIDLSRFWNWQDSPSDTAPLISDVTLPTDKQVTANLRGPSALPGTAPLINNINANPNAPESVLIESLAKAALAQQGFDVGSLTGVEALSKLILGNQQTADKARADGVAITKELNAEAMAIVGNILGGLYGNNPTAGSSAAAAVRGTPSGSSSSGGKGGGAGGNTGSGGEDTGGGTGGG
nr:hypothetical protein [Nitrosomonas nitrosa]